MKKLRVAAIQMISENANIMHNLDKASELVNVAAKNNSKLILLPEFMPTGYIFSKDIWDSAEPKNGSTVIWLKNISKKLKIWLGTSFLEADGNNFYNTFVLTNPHGQEAGRIRKQTPAGFETYFMAGESSLHVINSEFGKIGVGICYENQLSYMPKLLLQQSIDIHIMPHSAPTPINNIFFSKRSVELFINNFKNISFYYSKILGVPTILSNKCGKFKSPLPGMPFMYQESEFMGHSTIVDSDGSIKAQMGYEEGCIIEDITLDPSRKTNRIPEMSGHWSWDAPFSLNLLRMTEIQGKLNYKLNKSRKNKALNISTNN
jgi:N-carbamoylputrescine amidase